MASYLLPIYGPALLICAHALPTVTDVAELVLNRCTTTNSDRNARPDSEEYTVTFDYQFLEDRGHAEE